MEYLEAIIEFLHKLCSYFPGLMSLVSCVKFLYNKVAAFTPGGKVLLIFYVSIFFVMLLLLIFRLVHKRFKNKRLDALVLSVDWAQPLIMVVIFIVSLLKLIIYHGTLDPLLSALIFLLLYLLVVRQTNLFIKNYGYDSSSQKDSYKHFAQTAMLVGFGIVLIYVVCLFGLQSKDFLPFGIFATLLSLLFQDTIKSVAVYYHLHTNDLLHTGDWIEVPAYNIDGVITDISLVMVTIRNWDNTVSNLSMLSLQSGAFKNNQDMLDGRTSGRRMYRSFIVDSRSIKTLDSDAVNEIKERLKKCGEDVIALESVENSSKPQLNIYLYRIYLRHWLMNHKDLTRHPRLVLRLLEPVPEGVPLQVYTYITKTSVVPYELVQSSIMEHMFMSMEWFGLRIYQKPSSSDVSEISSDFVKYNLSDD